VIVDQQTDTVFISDLLSSRHPQIDHDLRTELGDRLKVIPGTKDIWCKDFMPVQVDTDQFVQFRYGPDYLKPKKYQHQRTANGGKLLNLAHCVPSDLVIDGGNIVRWHDAVIVTDKVYKENRGVERPRLRVHLQTLFGVDRLIVIPREPSDKIGHADGMVRFVDEKTVLVSDYRKQKLSRSFREGLAKALRRFEVVPFPYCPTGDVFDGIDSAEGVYINFLQISGKIFLPVFGQRQDDEAFGILDRVFSPTSIAPIRSNDLARAGGVLNCATWSIKSWS
jgi:agmatine deiminase